MEEMLGTLMLIYEILSGVGGIIQITLVLLRRTNNILLVLAMILDAVSLSGLSCGHILNGEPFYAFLGLFTIAIDVAFILYIFYREEHPKEAKETKNTTK